MRHKALVLFSGGMPAGGTITEAGAMLRYARRCHAHQLASLRRPLLEDTSTSTRENAVEVLSQLRQRAPRIRELHVVTNRFHQARACATFRRVANASAGRIAVRCTPTPPSIRSVPQDAGVGDHVGDAPAPPSCPGPARDPDPLEVSLVLARELAASLKYWAMGWV